MRKQILFTAFVLGAVTVAIGAFGAHGLKDLLIEYGRQATFETAVKYQFYHTFLLLAIGLLYDGENKKLKTAFYLVLTGITIFSGSLYILCLTNIGLFGAVTPFGGLALIVGWIFSALGLKQSPALDK